MDHPLPSGQDLQLQACRRAFLRRSGVGAGAAALALLESRRGGGLFAQAGAAGTDPAAVRSAAARVHPALPGLPHHAPKARSVIYIHPNGGPSQIDLWDHKPKLKDYFDKDLPPSVRGDQRLSTMTSGQQRFPVAPSKFKFEQRGACGRWINAELLPHTAGIVDDLALVKSVFTNAINHDPACTYVMTGSEVPGKGSLGSWLAYGLGSENDDLPAFVVFTPQPDINPSQALFTRMWSSGFLPTRFTGVTMRGAGDPVLYLPNPDGVTRTDRRVMLDALGKLNARGHDRFHDPETQTRIAQYEMAFRMQASVPDLVDLSGETTQTLAMYGDDVSKPGSFTHSLILARRLVERGVRVVQILHRGWDHHGNLPNDLKAQCLDTDQATAALVKDLKGRGMLDDTLVVWGGEFGRTVYSQGTLTADTYGRDHHPRNFCMWMAGGGTKGGTVLGETDDFSYNIVENPVDVNSFNATLLHLMGIDHERFTFKFQGLDQRLTGVEEQHVLKSLLA
ncbi:MAG: DUF1501 domain-containing protein [Planctomycetota bacterium]|nr:DUF1501 domain-containing protein [Planctomycetota bacterium]